MASSVCGRGEASARRLEERDAARQSCERAWEIFGRISDFCVHHGTNLERKVVRQIRRRTESLCGD